MHLHFLTVFPLVLNRLLQSTCQEMEEVTENVTSLLKVSMHFVKPELQLYAEEKN
jgi:hypothetical protein